MFLQRPPIDVNAAVSCRPRFETIHDTAEQLLHRSRSLRPHAGAVIRHAVTDPESAIQDPTFLEPIKEAVHEWWQQRKEAERYGVTWRSTNPQLNEDNCKGHYDQRIGFGERPSFGPLTVGLVLEGAIEYKLAVKRANPFVLPPQIFNPLIKDAEATPPTRTHTIADARAGDIVMFTNTPPTWHEVQAREGEKLTATFFTDFVQLEPLR